MRELSQFPSLSQILHQWYVVTTAWTFTCREQTRLHPLRQQRETCPRRENSRQEERPLQAQEVSGHFILNCMHNNLHLSFHHHHVAKSLLDVLVSFFAKPSIPKWMQPYESLGFPCLPLWSLLIASYKSLPLNFHEERLSLYVIT